MRGRLLFLLLCLAEGSLWLLPSAASLPVSTYLAAALLASLLLGAATTSLLHSQRSAAPSTTYPSWASLLLAASGVFAIPVALLAAAQITLSGTLVAALCAAIPVVVLVLWHALSAEQQSLPSALVPPLLGLAAVALLLPVRLPADAHEWVATASCLLAIALISWCGIHAFQLAQPLPPLPALQAVAFGNALGFGASLLVFRLASAPIAAGAFVLRPFLLAALASLAIQTLGALALQALEPQAFALRFIAVPVVAAVEGYLLWHPALGPRDYAAAALAAAALVLGLRAPRPADSTLLPVFNREH